MDAAPYHRRSAGRSGVPRDRTECVRLASTTGCGPQQSHLIRMAPPSSASLSGGLSTLRHGSTASFGGPPSPGRSAVGRFRPPPTSKGSDDGTQRDVRQDDDQALDRLGGGGSGGCVDARRVAAVHSVVRRPGRPRRTRSLGFIRGARLGRGRQHRRVLHDAARRSRRRLGTHRIRARRWRVHRQSVRGRRRNRTVSRRRRRSVRRRSHSPRRHSGHGVDDNVPSRRFQQCNRSGHCREREHHPGRTRRPGCGVHHPGRCSADHRRRQHRRPGQPGPGEERVLASGRRVSTSGALHVRRNTARPRCDRHGRRQRRQRSRRSP